MTAAIIVAAGSSARMGFDKLMAPLRDRPVLGWTLETFGRCGLFSRIVVVAHPDRLGAVRAVAEPRLAVGSWQVVAGGAQRHLSVIEGLRALPGAAEWVAVHDAARPLVTAEAIREVLEAARSCGAASLAHPVVDTLQRVDAGGAVLGPVDREGLWAMETPQAFRVSLLREAYGRSFEAPPTDEVSAVRAAGARVQVVASRLPNLKITRPADLELAARLLP